MTWQQILLLQACFALAFVLFCLLFVRVVVVRGNKDSEYQRGVRYGLGEGVKTAAAVLRKEAIKIENTQHEHLDNRPVAAIYRSAARAIEDALL